MPRPKRKCSVEGCDGAHVGRGYCMRHYQQMRYHGKLQAVRIRKTSHGRTEEYTVPDRSNYIMASSCCAAETQEGKQHDYGKQYCKTCGDPCLWSWQRKDR